MAEGSRGRQAGRIVARLALAGASLALGYRLAQLAPEAREVRREGTVSEPTTEARPALRPGQRYPDAPIILFSFDALRADRLSALSRVPQALMPSTDALARESVLFRHAYSCYPATRVAFPCLLTSRYVTELDPRHPVPSFTQALAAAGYRTGAITGSVALSTKGVRLEGFFQDYDADADQEARGDEDLVERGLAWLDKGNPRRQPFFLMLHIFSPHADYQPTYDENCRQADRALARFVEGLKRRGLYDRVILVVLSDHGESLQEHGLPPGHGWSVHEDLVRVPLLVRLPGQRQGMDASSVVRTLDVGPTLLDLVGAPPLTGVDGVSLRPLLERSAALDLEAYSFSTPNSLFPEGLLAVVSGHSKAIVSGFGERIAALYDVVADPDERYDLRHTGRGAEQQFARLERKLRRFQLRLGERTREDSPLAADAVAALRALGYLGGGSDPRTTLVPNRPPDPLRLATGTTVTWKTMLQLPQWSVYSLAYYADADYPSKVVPLDTERLLALQGPDRQISILPDDGGGRSTKVYQFPFQFVTDASAAPAPYDFAYLWRGNQVRLVGNRYRRVVDGNWTLPGRFSGLSFHPRAGLFLALATDRVVALDGHGHQRFEIPTAQADSARIAISAATGEIAIAQESGPISLYGEDGSPRARFTWETRPPRRIRSIAFDPCGRLWVGSTIAGPGDLKDPHQIWLLDAKGRRRDGFGVGDAGYGIWDPGPYGIVDPRQIVSRGEEMLVLDGGMRRIMVYGVACR